MIGFAEQHNEPDGLKHGHLLIGDVGRKGVMTRAM